MGLGKIGLPIAVRAAQSGYRVIGVDIESRVVDLVNHGVAPFGGEPGLKDGLRWASGQGLLMATEDCSSAVRESGVVIVLVPLVVDKEGRPVFQSIDSATNAIGAGLSPGTLVIYETTVPIGTTRDRFCPALEAASGLSAGTDFYLCFSPERVSSGTVFHDLDQYPKIVGGIDKASADKAAVFYESILSFVDRPDLSRPNGVWKVDDVETAEFSKLAETTYRDVNIALANQFAKYAHAIGVDFRTVLEASNSQPYSHLHMPGVAVGGHCIPVYPRLYLSTDENASIVKEARAANETMPEYSVSLLEGLMPSLAGSTIAILGAAYRGGVRETAFSGVFPIAEQLEWRGASVKVQDPLFSTDDILALGFQPYRLGDVVDGVIVQADHSMYRDLTAQSLPGVRAIVDGRGILNPANWQHVPVVVIGGSGVRPSSSHDA
ncbi:MAG TPA: nucleotide sugar dehydrogenase [Acidimicrobiales bacterium]|nr:nucleotide sugar dehydrogenase [Acidimicrobiales bacterium]